MKLPTELQDHHTVPTDSEIRRDFFRLIFKDLQGHLCIAVESPAGADFRQHWFPWPSSEDEILRFIASQVDSKNIWFSINLFSKRRRQKEYALPSWVVWADLDLCSPETIEPKPQIVIESSPRRFQAIWLLDQKVDPLIAEEYSHKIYLAYKDQGVDSGWALTKLLRVPHTLNMKYEDRPLVKLVRALEFALPTSLLDELVETIDPVDVEEVEILDPEPILRRHEYSLRKHGFFDLWTYEPSSDESWSEKLWRLELLAFEAGLSREEVFALAYASNFNKYKRDGRPSRYLWKEVLKAEAKVKNLEVVLNAKPITMPDLLPGGNYTAEHTLIEEYLEWAGSVTDASPIYHELCVFILLSALLSSNLKLDTSYGSVVPNIWGLILGDSTLTRKTTAMRMALDILEFVDRSILLATDGSAEGILTGLSARPRKASLFYRDEVVGLLEAIRRKDYLAGLAQLFTQLYDGGYLARRLRKEVVIVEDPIFIFFGGGIQDHFYTAVDENFIHSGFLPRFLIVCGQTDLSSIRRVGPPTPEAISRKKEIYEKMHKLYRKYAVTSEVEILGQKALVPSVVDAVLTQEAWDLYGDISERLTRHAYESKSPGLALPTFERMGHSLLKMSLLCAAVRQDPADNSIEVTERDVLQAAYYVQRWGHHVVDVIQNVGKTASMRLTERALRYIRENPGCARSAVMQFLNLDKRQMTAIEETLEARNEIRVNVHSRGRTYHPIA